MLRTFIAVRIEPTVALRRLHSQLAELGDRFRPVSPDNLHLTLKFLGETATSQIPEIGSVVWNIAEKQPATTVQLAGLGAFPHERRPSVIWVGFHHEEPLCQMAAALERDLCPLGFAPEGKAFHPHLTLLRVHSRPPE